MHVGAKVKAAFRAEFLIVNRPEFKLAPNATAFIF
jgi:hypothetical protein